MKRCPRCKTHKPTKDFYEVKSASDGLSSYCKPCAREKRRLYHRRRQREKIENFEPDNTLPGEEWRDVVGYEGWYQISNMGRVVRVRPGPHTWPGKILTLKDVRNGYKQVGLHRQGERAWFGVHVLVAEAFIGPRPKNHQVNHKNGDKQDNRPGNLEYLTQEEHTAHTKDELEAYWQYEGEDNPASKLTEEDVVAIRRIYSRGSATQREIAARFGIHQGTVSNIVNHKTWTHIT